jgi:hypothetical protein
VANVSDRLSNIEHWREDEQPRESSIPGVPERRSFDTGEYALCAAEQIRTLQDQLRGAVAALEAIAGWQHDPMDTYSYDAKEMQRRAADALNTLKGQS